MASASDAFFKKNPDQKKWVKKFWGMYLAPARSTLASMLAMPIDEGQKKLIHEALVLDNSLNTHRNLNTRLQ